MQEKTQRGRIYDLEDRTYRFADKVGKLVEDLPPSMRNYEYGKQLIRASGSVAANYIEANESLGKKDFLMRIRICRKESKESRLWLRLIQCREVSVNERNALVQESTELMKIFGAILVKSESRNPKS
jgi:four helix bundle protein